MRGELGELLQLNPPPPYCGYHSYGSECLSAALHFHADPLFLYCFRLLFQTASALTLKVTDILSLEKKNLKYMCLCDATGDVSVV